MYQDQFSGDLDDVMDHSRESGVKKILMPNVDHSTIDGMMEVEEKYPGYCTAMMGLHPCSVDKDFEKELYLVEEWLVKRSFVAIGEIGTDLYWDKSTFSYQQEAFTIQVNWASQKKIPVVIHCRESLDQTLDLLESHITPHSTGVFHCFTGNKEQAHTIISLGFKMGIGGVVSFKNSGLDQTLKIVHMEHLVLETDSPYLAPVPFRGKRNKPGYLAEVLNKMSQIYGLSHEEVEEVTTRNAQQLFKLNQ
jgi:TatD DNase family protein